MNKKVPIINQVVLPNGQIGITVDDGSRSPGDIKDVSEIRYERSEIPKELINECELLSVDGETHFIFDNKVTSNIKSQYLDSTEETRDFNLTEILSNDDKYHVGSELYFRELPSRFSYYDTETKLTGRYDRYNYIIKFIKNLGFEPSQSNFGPEFEQSFILEILDSGELYKYIIRVRPNLFIKMLFLPNGGNQTTSYDGFFKKKRIFESIEKTCPIGYKSIIRDEKIKVILNEKED